MTRLLIVGVGPRPSPAEQQVVAPGLRLDSMLRELQADGHQVALAEFLFGGQDKAREAPESSELEDHQNLPSDWDMAAEQVARMATEHQADAIIALTDIGALTAVRSGFDGPLFVDYNGHPMAERQMQAEVHTSNASLHEQWLHVLPVLLRADAFGTCSRAQRHALLGELGAAGRLNAETCGTELVHTLPVVLPFREPFQSSVPNFLRGDRVAADSRIILFTGGYNTWLDEALLFKAVEQVLSTDPKAVYVTTGGEIKGHVNKVFRDFQTRVENSRNRDRYHFLGWVQHNHFVDCCLEADVGVSCDRWTLEGELGCRNRLFGWLWGGMRAVMNDPTEITAEFAAADLIQVACPNDAADFAQKLGTELQRGRFSESEAECRRARLIELRGARECYAPLLAWARDPQPAADRRGGHLPGNPLIEWQQSALAQDESMIEDISELVQRMTGSRAMRVYATLHPEVQDLLRRIERNLPRNKSTERKP